MRVTHFAAFGSSLRTDRVQLYSADCYAFALCTLHYLSACPATTQVLQHMLDG